jgi:hypothetical protein
MITRYAGLSLLWLDADLILDHGSELHGVCLVGLQAALRQRISLSQVSRPRWNEEMPNARKELVRRGRSSVPESC